MSYRPRLYLALADYTYLTQVGQVPGLRASWWLLLAVPLLCGSLATLGCGGAALGRRIVVAALMGVLTALAATLILAILGVNRGMAATEAIPVAIWRTFILTILSTVGAILTELALPEPVER